HCDDRRLPHGTSVPPFARAHSSRERPSGRDPMPDTDSSSRHWAMPKVGAPAPAEPSAEVQGVDPSAHVSERVLMPVRMLNEYAYCPRLNRPEFAGGSNP